MLVFRMMWHMRVVRVGMVRMGVCGEVERRLDHGCTAAAVCYGMWGRERLSSEDVSDSMSMLDESADQRQPRGELVRQRAGVWWARVCGVVGVCSGVEEGEEGVVVCEEVSLGG